MYSGSTIRPLTGNRIGAHQKIDRLARISLERLLDGADFPSSRQIVHFEGVNGPDALKRKSPAKDEPWHFYDPYDDNDTKLIEDLSKHYDELVIALKKGDDIRAAFEAAWLAHALVDGLTPAHHYPYEEKLAEIRGGRSIETRDTLRNKLIMPGKNGREMLLNNWRMWGPKGLINMHGTFEWGVAVVLAPMTERHVAPGEEDLAELHEFGMMGVFRRKAKEVHVWKLYERYAQHGWTRSLASLVRNKLAPTTVRMVVLAWYAACIDAGVVAAEEPIK